MKELAHTCSLSKSGHRTDITCSVCNKQFASICILHDHISSCFSSSSYVYFHSKRVAYPLSKFCSLHEDWGKTQDEGRDSCEISILTIKEEIIDDDSADCLEKLLPDVEEDCSESTNKVCNIDTEVPNLELFVEESCEAKSKEEFIKTNTSCVVTKSDNEQIRHVQDVSRVDFKSKNNIETDAESFKASSSTDLNKTPSRKIDKIPSRKAPKRKYSTDKREGEYLNEKVNGSVLIHENSEHNHKPSLELVRKSRRLQKIKSASSERGVKNAELDPKNNHEPSLESGRKRRSPIKIKAASSEKGVKNTELDPDYNQGSSSGFIRKRGHQRTEKAEGEKYQYGRRSACVICGRDILVDAMTRHLASHSDERPFACDLCPKSYKTKSRLFIHKKHHESVLPHYCEVCGKGYVETASLRIHMMKHNNDRPHSCGECDMSFSRNTDLNRHVRTRHTGKKVVQCDQCGQRFGRKDQLAPHINLVHKRELRFQCSQCNQRFFTNYNLKCHIMRHKGIRPNKCKVCSAAFIQRKELRRHMKIKHNLKLETDNPSSDLKGHDHEDSLTERTSAVPNLSDQSRAVEGVSQSTHTDASSDCPPTAVPCKTVNQSEICDNKQHSSLT